MTPPQMHFPLVFCAAMAALPGISRADEVLNRSDVVSSVSASALQKAKDDARAFAELSAQALQNLDSIERARGGAVHRFSRLWHFYAGTGGHRIAGNGDEIIGISPGGGNHGTTINRSFIWNTKTASGDIRFVETNESKGRKSIGMARIREGAVLVSILRRLPSFLETYTTHVQEYYPLHGEIVAPKGVKTEEVGKPFRLIKLQERSITATFHGRTVDYVINTGDGRYRDISSELYRELQSVAVPRGRNGRWFKGKLSPKAGRAKR